QDAHTLLSLDRDRTVFIVADGVTTASVGSGDMASEVALAGLAEELPRRLREADTAEQFEAVLAEVFLDASEAILRRSLEEEVEPETDLAELMSSTALVGYVQGDVLTLACAGDSRAYLIRD